MKDAKDLIPWKVTDVPLRPYDGFWSMNPSVHFDGALWRCVLRCCDYAMPNGATIRSKKAGPGHQTKNAMVLLDPKTWEVVKTYKMHERDDHPRVHSANVGYEDMRIFKTDRGGLQGIAASLHLERKSKSQNGSAQHQPPEQVLLSFDGEYNIVAARPIRGDWWSSKPQKNWVPFDGCAEPRFLYSIDHGTMFDDRGAIHGKPSVQLSTSARPISSIAPDTSSQPLRHSRERQSARAGGAGRAMPPKYKGLRGGGQLVHVGGGAWLGIGHEMQFVRSLKYYWHTWYLVDSTGMLMAASPPMKLAPHGIEFAAGMAIDGERVVVSFGTDDMNCHLGETQLPAVLEMLQPVKSEDRQESPPASRSEPSEPSERTDRRSRSNQEVRSAPRLSIRGTEMQVRGSGRRR
jgi:hypothetical protein